MENKVDSGITYSKTSQNLILEATAEFLITSLPNDRGHVRASFKAPTLSVTPTKQVYKS